MERHPPQKKDLVFQGQIVEKLIIEKGQFQQGLSHKLLWCHLWTNKNDLGQSPQLIFVLLGRDEMGDYFTSLRPAFRQRGEGRELFLYCFFSMPSAQNTPVLSGIYQGSQSVALQVLPGSMYQIWDMDLLALI